MIQPDPKTIEEYMNTIYYTGDKQEKVEILEYNMYSDVLCRIVGTDYTVRTSMGNIKKGIRNPFHNNAPIAFESGKYKYENCIYPTNEGYHIKVIYYESNHRVHYIFLDSEEPHQGITNMDNIKKGQVRNPFRRNSFGGYLGTNEMYRNDNYYWLYRNWTNILIRGHEANKAYYNEHRPDTHIYDNTMLDPEWLNYSNYAEWYMSRYKSVNHDIVKEYVLDKDLLYRYYRKYTNDKKCYGPYCCELIPKDLNNKLSSPIISERLMSNDGCKNVLPPDHMIKSAALAYYQSNCISFQAYQAIMEL